MTETSERLCRDCKWIDWQPESPYSPRGAACLHAAAKVCGVHAVTGEEVVGQLGADDMRSRFLYPWRQTYCGLDGDLFEAREP